MEKVSWGILGVAKIATAHVIPAMQAGNFTRVDAIASRSLERAQKAADELGIPKAYGSYEEMLADPEIEAVYNPLPNHLHVPWSIKAAEAGKHVLCEKPIALSSAEAQSLIAARDQTGRLITEAFMVRAHPQWLKVRELIRSGRIGELRTIHGFFCYFNDDPDNIRNAVDSGGGGIMDIGCYPITTSRFIYDEEPSRVLALVDRDRRFKTDRLASAMLEYPSGTCTFTCGTQLAAHQRMQFHGTGGRIELEIPFNARTDRPSRVVVDQAVDRLEGSSETIEIPICNQYGIQGDLFSKCLREGTPPDKPLEDAVLNMRVIEALFRSAETGRWEVP